MFSVFTNKKQFLLSRSQPISIIDGLNNFFLFFFIKFETINLEYTENISLYIFYIFTFYVFGMFKIFVLVFNK